MMRKELMATMRTTNRKLHHQDSAITRKDYSNKRDLLTFCTGISWEKALMLESRRES